MAEGDDVSDEASPRTVEPTSQRAEQRIQELVGQLRSKDQELQTAIEMGKKATETASQFQARLASLEQQHQNMLQANLDRLDPDTRAQVLMDARMQQTLGEFEQRILGRIQPTLNTLSQAAAQSEMVALGQKYSGFIYQTHAPLIDQFRARNPHCSIEQAFRAIAEPEELVVRSAVRAQAVPPFVPPGNGDLGAARYASPSARQPQAQQEDELVEEARRIKELRASTDPAKQKEGMQLLDQHLKRRLGG
jgi:exonuclease VII small subunit